MKKYKAYSPWAYLWYLIPLLYAFSGAAHLLNGEWVSAVFGVISVAVTGYIACNWTLKRELRFVPRELVIRKSYNAETSGWDWEYYFPANAKVTDTRITVSNETEEAN